MLSYRTLATSAGSGIRDTFQAPAAQRVAVLEPTAVQTDGVGQETEVSAGADFGALMRVHMTPFQRSRRAWSPTLPAVTQALTVGHETLTSTERAVRGGCCNFQMPPLQRSITAPELLVPTAMQTFLVGHDTERRIVPPGVVAPDWMRHEPAVHCSIKGPLPPSPTAMHSIADGQATPMRAPIFAPLPVLIGCIDQRTPFHRSARGVVAPVFSSFTPTATQLLPLEQDTLISELWEFAGVGVDCNDQVGCAVAAATPAYSIVVTAGTTTSGFILTDGVMRTRTSQKRTVATWGDPGEARRTWTHGVRGKSPPAHSCPQGTKKLIAATTSTINKDH
jgi:hypothetical protein